jgi:hypothetical protein
MTFWMEGFMLSRILSGGGLAVAVGAVALVLAARPAPAFTLAAPSLDRAVLSAAVDKVWWDRWGYWHRPVVWGVPRYGFYGPRYGFYNAGPVRRCWRGPLGYLRCGW